MTDRIFAIGWLLVDLYVLYHVFLFTWFGEPLDAKMGSMLMLVVAEAIGFAVIRMWRGDWS